MGQLLQKPNPLYQDLSSLMSVSRSLPENISTNCLRSTQDYCVDLIISLIESPMIGISMS